MNDADLNIKFYEKYNIKVEFYENVKITTFPFSVRTLNCFKKNKVKSVSDLLQLTPLELLSFRSFGKTCLNEVNEFCSSFLDDTAHINIKKSLENEISSNFIKKYRTEFSNGDFSKIENLPLDSIEKKIISKYKETFEILGQNLVLDCINHPQKIRPIINILSNFNTQIACSNEFEKLLQEVPKSRLSNIASGYINAFSIDTNERKLLNKLCYCKGCSLLTFFNNLTTVELRTNYILIVRFLKWCTFDLQNDIQKIFESLYLKDNTRKIIKLRAKKHTLGYIGSEIGVSRERIRQIESKCVEKFTLLESRIQTLTKINAENNSKSIISFKDIEKVAGEYTQDLIYLLQLSNSSQFKYITELEIFIVGDDWILHAIDDCVESLPDFVKVSDKEQTIREVSKQYSLSYELLEKVFDNNYNKRGDLYHKNKISLSLGVVYSLILEKHYPSGLNVYDSIELNKFRKKTIEEYGEIGIPDSNRALTAGIINVCVLCGRGMYRLNTHNFIPNALAEKIFKFIVESKKNIFLMNSIFSLFKEELIANGISNKYFLQGILHDLYGDKLTFRKDYVSKDPEFKSFYSEVANFIKNSNYPVSRDQIKSAFPGITDIIINFSVKRPEILNFFGQYMDTNHLNFTNDEKDYLLQKIQSVISDGKVHHIKKIYNSINFERREILTKNSAMDSFSAFSVLEYLFKDYFQFSRPYIAQHGVEIGTPSERMHDFVSSMDEITISEIRDFASYNHVQITSILDFINEYNSEFLLVNKNLMIKISKLGIDESIAKKIDEIFAKNISKTSIIADLYIPDRLPKINYPWTDWLIYSVIKKWGKQTTVGTTSNQFRYSMPLIAPFGALDTSMFKDINLVKNENFRFEDDDSIDDFIDIEEMIDDNLLDYL